MLSRVIQACKSAAWLTSPRWFTSRVARKKMPWEPPPQKRHMVNLDASFKNEEAAMAFVVRDDTGEILHAAAALKACKSSQEAEEECISWAMDHPLSSTWKSPLWVSDCKRAVDSVNITHNSKGVLQDRKQLIHEIRGKLKALPGSELKWDCREKNMLADELANVARREKTPVDIDGKDLTSLSTAFKKFRKLASAEKTAVGKQTSSKEI